MLLAQVHRLSLAAATPALPGSGVVQPSRIFVEDASAFEDANDERASDEMSSLFNSDKGLLVRTL